MCKMAGARLDQGLPLPTSVLPPFGGYKQWRKCTISISEREALGIVGYNHPACRSPRADPFEQGCAQRAEANVDQGRAWGFALMIKPPGKAHQVHVENHG